MLDKLSDFLVEFYHVWLSVNEILNLLPIFKQSVRIGLLRPSSERVNKLAEHLRRSDCLSLWLFNPQDILVEVESHF